ncbi:VOC family protein [Methylopila sp. M107]|uniref:VOC family protein n=1 Tax=Methylopila sp. M107 TaxID=1101190 RepID=UPI000369E3DB|nr:VOC family protein [Methylopila sp. M107]
MPQLVFINLPVTDLAKSIAFYKAVGATQNLQFSDDTAACMVLSEQIHVMLLTHAKFRQFTTREIPDAKKSAQALIAINRDSKEAVDKAVADATAAGGGADPTPTQDLGFMYGRSYDDPDGHIWEVFWMDPAAVQGGDGETAA